jgi:hypothetical protein
LIELLLLPLLQRDFLFWSAVLHSLLLLVSLEAEEKPSRRVVVAMVLQLLAGRLGVPGAGFVEVVLVVVVVAVVGVPMPMLVCGHWSRCWA